MKYFWMLLIFSGLMLACTATTPTATERPAAATGTDIPPVHFETNSVLPEVTETLGATQALTPGMASVWVYFTMASDENMTPVPVARLVPDSNIPAALVHSTLKELLKGPSDAERDAGLASWFSPDTMDAVTGVILDNDELTVDFVLLNVLIPNASTSAGSQMLLSQLNSTVFQFDFVQTVQYTLDGDCAAFWEWLQMGCHPVTRAEWEAG